MRLSEIKGIGDKTEQLFNKVGVDNTDDLIVFLPRGYDEFEPAVFTSEIDEEKIYAVEVVIMCNCTQIKKGAKSIITTTASDERGGRLMLYWFNMPFIMQKVKKGYRMTVRGAVSFSGSTIRMTQPQIYTHDEYEKLCGILQPLYPLTKGLSNNMVKKTVSECLKMGITRKEYLPLDILSQYNLIDRKKAIMNIHFPHDRKELFDAKKRLAFDDFFSFLVTMKLAKEGSIEIENKHVIPQGTYIEKILKSLPYELTNAQKRALSEIMSDVSDKAHCMNRLVQGDVGSGKTIIALLCMAACAEAGFQSALMAPTEVLATQHYEEFTKVFKNAGIEINICLLTGSTGTAEKKRIYSQMKDKSAQIIIGTHALITQSTEYGSLGLVITDEQHRFGVKQRESLSLKGDNPHLLVMSATPIPRSLAIILYGDLDISVIDEKPANRLPVKNCVVNDEYMPNCIKLIKNEIAKGHQAYVICALAKENEENEENEEKNVRECAEELREQLLTDIKVEYLHGKMKNTEKDRIFSEFSLNRINVLVSTTVVEVGVNVQNATVMLVLNSERFGLATLHQLRGRIGRGDAQSYCVFMSNSKKEETRQRLSILEKSNDGFKIAEQDLKMRGPGDMMGIRQSGQFEFLAADIYEDADMLRAAASAVNALSMEQIGQMNVELRRLNI